MTTLYTTTRGVSGGNLQAMALHAYAAQMVRVHLSAPLQTRQRGR